MSSKLTSRVKAQMAILLSLVFLCGVVTGVLFGRTADLEDASLSGPYVERMVETFGLDQRQERIIRLVLAKRDRAKRGLLEVRFRDSLPANARIQLWYEDQRADRRIRALLNPTQQNQYDGMLARGR